MVEAAVGGLAGLVIVAMAHLVAMSLQAEVHSPRPPIDEPEEFAA